MKKCVLVVASLLLIAAPVSAQAPVKIAWDFYPGASASQMTALNAFGALLDAATQPVLLAPACANGTCEAALPTLQNGTTHTVRLVVACVSSPAQWGPPSGPATFTVGTAATITMVTMAPAANPCAPAAPQPTPPPQPPASGAVTCAGSVWTLDDAVVMRNGQPTIGIADALLCVAGTLYAERDGQYYAWLGGGFSSALPDPRGAGTPPPTPPAPTSYTCTIESAVTRYALTAAQKKAGQTKADVKYTAIRCPPDTPFGKGARIVVTVSQ